MSRIGDAIKAERKACGMTIQNLARTTKQPTWLVDAIEDGRFIPHTAETILDIANVFPDVDTAAWLWLLLADLWGEPIADLMRQHARATSHEEAQAG